MAEKIGQKSRPHSRADKHYHYLDYVCTILSICESWNSAGDWFDLRSWFYQDIHLASIILQAKAERYFEAEDDFEKLRYF